MMFGTLAVKGRLVPPLVVFSAACGLLAWGHGLTPLAALSVLAWGFCTTRASAWLVVFAYYMGGSWVIPGSSVAFFGEQSGYLTGIAFWIASSALLALPWAAFRPSASPLATVARLMAALLLVSLPPIGIIGWLNPWLGASLVLPGMAWLSLAIGLGLLGVFAVVGRARYRLPAAVTAVAVCAIAAFEMSGTPLPAAPQGWWTAQLQAGRTPSSANEQGQRQALLVQTVDRALAQGARVIVLPEHFLGRWSDSWQIFLEHAVGAELRQGQATLVVGAEVMSDEPGRTVNAAIAYDGTNWRIAGARFAMPVSMWKPWSSESATITWVGDGIYLLEGRRFMLSLCFEDVTVWLPVLSFLSDPDLVVSMANAWWATRSPRVVDIQREHIEAWSRIFKVPLVRALNAP